MNLQYRIDLLIRLGDYILSADDEWLAAKAKASRENGWFIPEFVDLSANNIARAFLDSDRLNAWVNQYKIPSSPVNIRKVGIIMAGNLPLVGFHDFLCVFICGHHAVIKPSSKDDVLIRHLIKKLVDWEPAAAAVINFADMLKGCDAYIATGSNNSAGYFDFYFRKYPAIIRRNRTSVAILSGNETPAEIALLADDVHLYFGLGCRNVTKLFVPDGYDFVPILDAFRKYQFMADHHKYKNNYDYNLAIHLLNRDYYMTNESLLLIENPSFFSPISVLYYETYNDVNAVTDKVKASEEIQCVVGSGFLPFGQSQQPALDDFADGVNTIRFLQDLEKQ